VKRLRSLSIENGILMVKFNIAHNNGETTVDQDLILRKTGYGWTADMKMEEFPELKTITAAAWKLAEWLERLGAEIKRHEFDVINLNSIDV
jgi:hypothetical protein